MRLKPTTYMGELDPSVVDCSGRAWYCLKEGGKAVHREGPGTSMALGALHDAEGQTIKVRQALFLKCEARPPHHFVESPVRVLLRTRENNRFATPRPIDIEWC